MTLTVFDCEQNSPEWYACRRGIPTASEFATVMASGRGGGDSKTRRKYLYTLVGEILTGNCIDGYTNAHMERGKEMEAEARAWYAFHTDTELQRVGFIKHEEFRCGASPDSLIGEDGGLEVKTKLPHLHLELLESDELPSEHRAQIQGTLWLTGRKWWDFVSYWPNLPPFVLRVYPDETYIAAVRTAVRVFNLELDQLVAKFQKAA